MKANTLFCTLSSIEIAELIRNSKRSVCFAGPGIQMVVAQALKEIAQTIGREMITLNLDFDERIMRMGYGNINAVELLKANDIDVHHVPGLRTGLIITDDEGYVFTPTPLYLEAEPEENKITNAVRLSRQQVVEALGRLSPAGKVIALAQAKTSDEKIQISKIPVEISTTLVGIDDFNQLKKSLDDAPPVKFDVARQVRVFEPYIQYVELSLSGASIQRHRLEIPKSIQNLGNGKELEGRLRTTFELIEKSSDLSSKELDKDLQEIRKNFTPSLGKDHGRVILKSSKSVFNKRIGEFEQKLAGYREKLKNELQKHIDESKRQIMNHFLPLVIQSPPDALIGQILSKNSTETVASSWLTNELDRVFPEGESLISEMRLDVRYKDVTYETLNRDDFLASVKAAFPFVDWERAHKEFLAAGEHKNVQ